MLLSDITIAKNNREIYLTAGSPNGANTNRETLDRMQSMLEEQSERQQAALDEMNQNIRNLSKTAQKGKFGLFK